MQERRLVGIDLGITSAHTVRVLSGDGSVVCRRKAVPIVQSLGEVERVALAGAAPGPRLEVVLEPTGPAWLPIALFFCSRGHTVYRVSSAKAHDLRRFLRRHAKSNGIDADTLARLPLVDPAGLHPLQLPDAARAALDRRVRATDRLTPAGRDHKRRIKDLVRQLLPASPLAGELGRADLAVLERYADPMRCWLLAGLGWSGSSAQPPTASRAPLAPSSGWMLPAKPRSCTATTPRSPSLSWPPRSTPRSTCLPPPRPNWPTMPATGSAATGGSTRRGWPAACPAWPRSAARPWAPPWARAAASPPRPGSGPSPAWPHKHPRLARPTAKASP
jgi:hypothetical protein